MLKGIARRAFQLRDIEAGYRQAVASRRGRSVYEALAEVFEITPIVSAADREKIPRSGPLVVVANHPTGGMDGILLSSLLLSVRRDVRMLAHVWFKRFPDLAEHMIFVDPTAGGSARANARGVTSAVRWVKDGGALLVYPAGTVSFFRPGPWAVTDAPWQPICALLLRASRATTLPVHMDGRNGLLFHALCNVHPRLGVLRLPHELVNKRGKSLAISIGEPITYEQIPSDGGAPAVTDYLRRQTYRLAGSSDVADRST
jgi:putative hemolysin